MWPLIGDEQIKKLFDVSGDSSCPACGYWEYITKGIDTPHQCSCGWTGNTFAHPRNDPNHPANKVNAWPTRSA